MKSNHEQLRRQLMLVNILKTGQPMHSKEIYSQLENYSKSRGYAYPESDVARKRMLQRDIARIDETMYITISYAAGRGYSIEEDCEDSFLKFEQLFSDFDLLTSINPDSRINKYILPEHHRGMGSDNLYPLLHAIKNNLMVEYDYMFVRDNDRIAKYIVKPYFLKENQQRWYLVAEDNGKIKNFGIDRISNLNVTEQNFKRDLSINPDALFRDSYGIWDDPNSPVEYIELKYDALDGKFLKSLPLHRSQQIIVDDDDEFRISLRLKITNDFRMALLARSRSLEVISPVHLREYIKHVALNCAKRNS